MIRKSTSNTFEKGLLMDMNPITTPNNVMTSSLNTTLITYNGNEYILQSDMGNGRVETAYLPAGFVPVGMVEFGGIIYVVSYNPLINKSQIGSFPSPERNISTEELNQGVTSLSNADFGWANNTDGANVFYVQKNLYADKLTPGDKYLVYAKKGQITGNKTNLWECFAGKPNVESINGQLVTKVVKLSFATITDEGKIVTLGNLKGFNYGSDDEKYIIPEIEYDGATGTPNLDSYRSLIQSPYNIFNSKVSGKLLLIAELITIDELNLSVTCQFIGDDTADTKDVEIYIDVSYASDLNVFLYGLTSHINDSKDGENNFSYMWNNTTEESDSQIEENRSRSVLMYTVKGYDYKNRAVQNIEYTVVPCMSFGPISYLERTGIIQLDKIGTGYIELYEWRYYIDNSNIMINWALQSYPEEGYGIAGIKFIMSCYDRRGEINTCVYNVSKKQSYNGSFMETIPFDSEYYKFNDGGILLRDRLYYVTIEVQYQKKENGDDTRFKYFHRWLYTTSIFNQNYLEGELSDFKDIQPDIAISIDSSLSLKKTEDEVINTVEGQLASDYVDGETRNNVDSMHAKQYYNKYKLLGGVKLRVDTNYNLFVLDTDSVTVSMNATNDNVVVNINDYQILSTGDVTTEAEEYLNIKPYTGWTDGNIIPLPDSINAAELIDEKYGNAAWTSVINMQFNNGDVTITEQNNIQFNTLEYIKAYGKIADRDVTWSGQIKPVADTEEEFRNYNLVHVSNGIFKTNFMGSWARTDHRASGSSVRTYFSWVNSDNTINNIKGKDGCGRSDNPQSIIKDYQDYIKEMWTAGLGSSIVTVIWGSYYYGGNYDCGSGLTDVRDRGNVVRNNTWAYPMTGGSNDQFCFIQNKNGRVAISRYTGVMVFMKTAEDEVYVPINMMSRAEYTPTDINDIRYQRNVGGDRTNAFSIPSVHTAIALMLIQLYKYENSPGTKHMWVPIVAYYIQRITTDFGINITINSVVDNAKLYVKTDDDVTTKVYIDETMRTSLFNENHGKTSNGTPNQNDTDDVDENPNSNIDYKFGKEPLTTYVGITSIKEDIDLRDKIIEAMKTNFKTMVQKNDGTNKVVDYEYREDYCYMLNDTDTPSRITNNFVLTGGVISVDGDKFRFTSNNIVTSDTGEFAKKVCMKNGVLVLNDTGTGENTGMMDSVKIGLGASTPNGWRGNDVKTASITGWSTFAPFYKLKFFNKR